MCTFVRALCVCVSVCLYIERIFKNCLLNILRFLRTVERYQCIAESY